MDSPDPHTPPSPWQGPIPTTASSPAQAHYAWVDAVEAMENEHHHVTHPVVHPPIALRFNGADKRRIIVWSDQPACLAGEMRDRGCVCDGQAPVVGEWVDRVRCPTTIEEMPW